MENMTKAREHKIASKKLAGPIIGLIVGIIVISILNAIYDIIVQTTAYGLDNWGISLCSIIFLLIFWLWFKPEFKGATPIAKWSKELWIPFIVTFAWSIINGSLLGNFSFTNMSINILTMGVAAGIGEETMFRVVPLSLSFRNNNTTKSIWPNLILFSVLFGVFHMINMTGGAGLGVSIIQVIGAGASGLVFGALYLRTGSILPSMVLHGVHDMLCFMDTSTSSDTGIVIASVGPKLIIPEAILLVLNIAMAIYMLRPAIREEIVEIWDEKWSRK